MTRTAFLTIASLINLSACAGATSRADLHRPPHFRRAVLVPEHASAPSAASAALQLARATPRETATAGTAAPAHGSSPVERVEAANRAASREPETGGYAGAVQVYPWTRGALYRLYTAPGQVSDIALQPGETLISVAAGDTARWVIGDTASGSGDARRTHILIKPTAVGLRTNLVIATDRRVYHLSVESTQSTAMAGMSWRYPEQSLLALQSRAAEASVADSVPVERLNFNYRIEGDTPPWRPVRAFDDGTQVFIEFPPTLARGEAPPLFVTGDKGRAELVNYRVRGRYYVVDRLFAAAELRLGERYQQVVRIVRQGRR